MSFARYLDDDRPREKQNTQLSNNTLDIQIPPFLYQNPVPTLAHGGGAEVVTFSPGWFTNAFSAPTPLPPQIPVNPVVPPSSAGLPVYSASGFDLLSLLARVATRPNPQVPLGPVDLTCSFVVVDTRRYDHPIVYCSPSFCRLTGYDEHEILGRNCRFLQAPGGAVKKGETRRFTSQEPVRQMHKNLSQDKEVQTSIVNFRKDGTAFINLVTVIPIQGGVKGEAHEKNDYVWQIGFQVDLTQQPGVILDKVRDGTYVVDQHTAGLWNSQLLMSKDSAMAVVDTNKKKASTIIPQIRLSDSLHRALRRHAASTSEDPSGHPLSLLLLANAPDFIHVVSLKGHFLYISPAVTRILGYDPSELLNKTMSDLAHPEDIVPLERQLKESSTLLLLGSGEASDAAGNSAANSTNGTSALVSNSPSAQPRPVDLVFRARTKQGRYVWLECRGRLHVEPGKGKKAIILSGRAREMGSVKWAEVKEMEKGPTITRALIQSALAAASAGQNPEDPLSDNPSSPSDNTIAVSAGTKRRRESSAATTSSTTLPASVELSTLPAKTTTAVHPHHRPLPGTITSSSSASLSPSSLTPPASSRHTEFWGMLSGLGHASGSFISLSRGVSDVLGYRPASTTTTTSNGSTAAGATRPNLVATAVNSLHQQQEVAENSLSSGAGGAIGGDNNNESVYQAMNAGSSPSSSSASSLTSNGIASSSPPATTLSSLNLRDALIGRRLRDLIVADSDMALMNQNSPSPAASSGYPNSPSPYTPSPSSVYNEAANFGVRPRNKGKQNSMGDVREVVEGTLRAWEEESRMEAKAREMNARFPPSPVSAQGYDYPQHSAPPRASRKAKGKTSNQTVTVRCWMKTVNSRGEWSLHAPVDGSGNVVPVVVTLYRATVAPMGDADLDHVARGTATLRDNDPNAFNDDDIDVASPPTLVQIRIDVTRAGGASLVSSPEPTSPYARPPLRSSSSAMSITSDSPAEQDSHLNTHRTHPPEANMFAELETGRGSSWQYELQQMRFQNRRMLEEIVGIEEALNKDKQKDEPLSPEPENFEVIMDTSSPAEPERSSTTSATLEQQAPVEEVVEAISPEVHSTNDMYPTSPIAEMDPVQHAVTNSGMPAQTHYEYPQYPTLSPVVGYGTIVDNSMYASNPSPVVESPVISNGGYQQQYTYPHQQAPVQQETYDYSQQQTQPQAGPYGYDDGYNQPQYQAVYAHPQYVQQQQQTYVDEPMTSPIEQYHPQPPQPQYTLHQPQPQHQHQRLDWGTAPTHHYQQRRRSTYDGR